MLNLFPTHKDLTEEDYKMLWERCLFILDTNVLLDLYRLPKSASTDLINLLLNEKLRNRIWIPFQVSLEFTYNKLDAISDQKNKFTTVKKIITEALSEIDVLYLNLKKKIDDLQLQKRHSMINSESFINQGLFKLPIEILDKFTQELNELEQAQPDVNDKDEIGEQVSKIFEGKIGNPFSKLELESLYKEAEGRYKESIPPGYKDANKPGVYLYRDSKYIRKFGDLILWKELIRKCKSDGLEYVVLVTGDVKEDWWREKRGRKLGPRFELLNEIYFEAETMKIFHIYDTSNFMQKAKEYFQININQKSIEETKDLLEYNNTRKGLRPLSIGAVIKMALEKFPTVGASLFGFGVPKKVIKIPRNQLLKIFYEVFSNIESHSSDGIVEITFQERSDYFEMSFKNKIKQRPIDDTSFSRGVGLLTINNILSNYKGGANYHIVDNFYILSLFFDKEFVTLQLNAD